MGAIMKLVEHYKNHPDQAKKRLAESDELQDLLNPDFIESLIDLRKKVKA